MSLIRFYIDAASFRGFSPRRLNGVSACNQILP